mgnify:CR=1 FL=1|tara:strand:+ start:62 stop:1582 length:1521 start_codon:yes stop_codon:yes gene_type:complete
MKILDCTLRDGGYYTNWDFDNKLVNEYLKLVKNLPIDIIEIGYRGNTNKKSYLGEFYFLTTSNLKKIKSKIGKNKKLSIMIDTKDWNNPKELKNNLSKCKGIVNIVRFAVNPRKISKIKNFLKITKELGFEVAVNLMYSHIILKDEKIIKNVLGLKKYFNILYIVDSYGTLISGNVKSIINKIKSLNNKILLGFHSHNNLELALSNSIEAINNEINYLDSTFTGMGRGAGNLKTELLLSYLSLKKGVLKIKNFKNIGFVVDQFEKMKLKEKWGTSLPYMISGSTQSPQSEAMQLIKSKRYDMTDIITYLYKKDKIIPKVSKTLSTNKKDILIVGGGESVKITINYIREYLVNNPKTFIIFSSSRNLDFFKKIKNKSIICITGNEITKIKKSVLPKNNFLINNIIDDKTILPKKVSNFFKLKKNELDKKINNSPLAISLAAAQEIKAKNIYLVGFDGFEKNDKINDYSLFKENQNILNFYKSKLKLISLTDTIYENLLKSSIFKHLN